eukprot:CAMPEP_0184450822 /NCGR_PEP_ID=MMETSP0740-20130409/6021_1 /TAXON_ID=385413 /ORGANISM="Thalassiosira miniscula, Strain CCMP1093" /LENGTH=114 /DNA_ID=CAMNT_0026821187 /DNA_START=59 /DNA_END=399 /DNA_ORIENTATION=-
MKRPDYPLSAYNLFHRFKQCKILRARKNGNDSAETITRLIAGMPGLEEYPSIANSMSPQQVDDLRQTVIRSTIQENDPDKDDIHNSKRKPVGNSLSFVEVNNLMFASWTSADDS